MALDLKQEIADRLDASPDDVAPVLDHVVERIRQQVAHYGYARISGLGTFRGGAEELTFEPDPVLEETINVRFSGLTPVQIAAPPEAPERVEEPKASGAADFKGVEEPPSPEMADFEGVEEASTPGAADFEGLEEPSTPAAADFEGVEEPTSPEPADFEGVEEPPRSSTAEFEGIEEPPEYEEEGLETPDEAAWYEEFEDRSAGERSEFEGAEDRSEALPPDFAGFEEPEADERESAVNEEIREPSTGEAAPYEGFEETDESGPAPYEGFGETDQYEAAPLEGDEETEESDSTPFEGFEETGEPTAYGASEDQEAEGLWREQDEDAASERRDESESADYAGFEEPEGLREPDLEGTEYADEPERAEYDGFEEPAEIQEEDDLWSERREEHPSGEETYEDAEFSMMGGFEPSAEEETADEEAEDNEPTVTWSPIDASRAGADDDEASDVASEEAERPEDADEEESAVGHDETAEAGAAGFAASQQAPDRGALPHERLRPERPTERAARGEAGGGPAGNRSIIWIGAGVVVLVAALGIVYLTLLQPEPTEQIAEETSGQEAPPPDTAAAAADTTALAAGEEAAPEETPPVQPEAESTPLRSPEGIDRSAGGYTIVVFSETSESLAQDVADRYSEQGYRTGALAFEEGGGTRYRVGVGQFQTLDEATAERDLLAGGELPDDAWILRIE